VQRLGPGERIYFEHFDHIHDDRDNAALAGELATVAGERQRNGARANFHGRGFALPDSD